MNKTTTPDSHTFVSASNTNIWCPYEGEGCTAMGLLHKELIKKGLLDFSKKDVIETKWQSAGTSAHDIAAINLIQLFTKQIKLTDLKTDTDEEYVAAEYSKWVFKKFCFVSDYSIEEKFFLTTEVGGTCDFKAYEDAVNTLHIVDLKSGFQPVWAEENSQELCYAACEIDKYPNVEKVELHIYQPGDEGEDPVDSWDCKPEVVHNYKKKMLKVLDKIEARDVQFKAGSHCQYCKAKPFCSEHDRTLKKVLEIVR